MSRLIACSLVAVMTAASASLSEAGKFNRVVNIGDQGPSIVDLPSASGKTYSLDSFRDSKAVAIVFTCNNCPVAVAYQDRLMKLAADYKQRGVTLVAINVNRGEDLAKMQQLSEEKGFNFPYLRDESQQSAREYGATCTPHAFLLDQDRKIVYMGAIDDNWQDSSNAEKTYLRNAIDSVLTGKTPADAEAKQVGCGIRWKG